MPEMCIRDRQQQECVERADGSAGITQQDGTHRGYESSRTGSVHKADAVVAGVGCCNGCLLYTSTGCLIEHFGNADAVPQPPERCLSRKAGIVRCCLIDPALPGIRRLPQPPARRAELL